MMANEDIIRALTVCSELSGLYNDCAVDSNARPVSMNVLTQVVKRYSGKDIFYKEAKWQSQYIKGRVKVWSDRAEIVIPQDQNRCWKRFVACKELAHVAIDSVGTHTQNIIDLIRSCCSPVKPSAAAWPIDRDVTSERIAIIAAGELLFPFAERHIERDKILSGSQKYLDIASFYRIPEVYVEYFLSERMMDTLAELHRQVDLIP